MNGEQARQFIQAYRKARGGAYEPQGAPSPRPRCCRQPFEPGSCSRCLSCLKHCTCESGPVRAGKDGWEPMGTEAAK